MARIIAVLALSLVLVVAFPASAPASVVTAYAMVQDTSSDPAVSVSPAQEAGPRSSGLPRRAPDPITLREYWPVFLAFVLTWIAIVGYFLSIGRSFGRTARAVAGLEDGRSAP